MERRDYFRIGHQFRITNPDYHVSSEVLTVEVFEGSELRLRSLRRNVVDTACTHYSSEFTLLGRIVAEGKEGVEVRLLDSPVSESRVQFQGDEATWIVE